ncbi:MAG: hypothetical protein R3E60_00760 [Alphaproteobacteria bacterium]
MAGKTEAVSASRRPSYDPGCYLCPGNTRVGGHENPPYESTLCLPMILPP